MKKIITVTDKEKELIISLEIDWENKTVNLISKKEHIILEDD